MEKTIVELFAGVGGFRVGFESVSKEFKTVWANQWEPSRKSQYAFECYKKHFEKHGGLNKYSNSDITLVKNKDIPNHSILVGGFPCQDYSVARTGASGIHGKKGVLWWEIDRIIKAKKPPFVLLENVDRLLKSPTSQRGRDFAIMLKCFSQNGYNVEWRVINAADYGFQQKRRRVFIFATKRKSTNYANIYTSSSTDILGKIGFFAKCFPIKENFIIKKTKIEEKLIEISDTFNYSFENAGYMTSHDIFTAKVYPSTLLVKKPKILKDLLECDVDSKFYISKSDIKDWKYIKGSKAIERTTADGFTYIFREGAIPFPDNLNIAARTMLTSETSKNRSTHIIKDPSTGKLRKLTPVECERINGFRKNWTNTGMPESFRYFCMGNALVVNLIKVMAKQLDEIISQE